MVKPNSKHREEVELHDGTYIVWTAAPAHEGQATTAVRKLLARHFGTTYTKVVLKRGAKSRYKEFEIIDALQSATLKGSK